MVAATCVFEGTAEEVNEHKNRLARVAEKFGGMGAGEENGRYVREGGGRGTGQQDAGPAPHFRVTSSPSPSPTCGFGTCFLLASFPFPHFRILFQDMALDYAVIGLSVSSVSCCPFDLSVKASPLRPPSPGPGSWMCAEMCGLCWCASRVVTGSNTRFWPPAGP